MAITVSRYDRIIFYGGKFLEYPVFSSLTVARGDEFVSKGKNVLWAARYHQAYQGLESLTWYGLPTGTDDSVAWTDLDGHKWWIELTGDYQSGNNTLQKFIVHRGPYGNSSELNIMKHRGDASMYMSSVSGEYLYGNGNNVRICSLDNWGSGHAAVNGLNDYINAYNRDSQFTWDNYPSLNVNYAYGQFMDAYNFNPYYRDFGYWRVKVYAASGNKLSYYTAQVNAANTFPISYTKGVTPEPYDDDPNKQGGNSGTGGGHGNFDRTSDSINVPSLPTLNATRAGFVTLYKPSLSDLVNLAEYLWSSNIINILIQYFSNPMDIIIGLGIVPVDPTASTSGFPSAGTITVPYSFSIIDSQYYELDCGTIRLEEFWGSALDYAPYTQVQIYLPYVGVRELNVDEIMGRTIGVKYHIDLFGGACVAFVTVDGSAKYQFSGNCLQQIPVNAANYDQLVQNLVSVACVVGSGIAASGSAGVAAAVGSESAALGAGELSQSQAITKGLAGAEYADVRAAGASEWMSENGSNLNNCVVSSVMGSKPRVERTGALAATTGQLCSQTPYLIITRPEQSLPNNYKHYEGYPSNITSRLGSLSGFTKVESIRLNDLAATQPELMEIYSLLYKGVII